MQYVSAVNFVYGARFTAGLIGVINNWQRVKEAKEYEIQKNRINRSMRLSRNK
jgi:hypothetical protein